MVTNTDIEIAIEIIAAKIATHSRAINNTIDDEMKKILKERDKVYMGNEETIKKVLSVYGPEVRGDDRDGK